MEESLLVATQTSDMWIGMADTMIRTGLPTMAIRTTQDLNTGIHGDTDMILITLGVRDAIG